MNPKTSDRVIKVMSILLVGGAATVAVLEELFGAFAVTIVLYAGAAAVVIPGIFVMLILALNAVDTAIEYWFFVED
jgi:hypothetical protein